MDLWIKEFSLFLFIAAAFLFSFLARITIFRELDYHEIKYTPKTKDAMANIFQSTRCLTLATNLTTAAFGTVTISRFKNSMKKSKTNDKGETNKIVAYMFDFKSEVVILMIKPLIPYNKPYTL